MSEKKHAGVRLKPTPVDVFRFADAVTELRYRLVINYLRADPDDGEVSPPKVVRETFQKLLAVTFTINDGRPEDQKLEGHVIAGRAMKIAFERKWLEPEHRLWLEDLRNARQPYAELNEYDLADIRRNGTAESDPEGLSAVDAEALLRSPFNPNAWTTFEEAVAKFVATFDAPCQTLYRLVRTLAEDCYPNPATYDTTLGTLSVYDDEHLIKHIRPQVNQLLAEFQSQTCFQFNFGEWFDAANPYGSITKLHLHLEQTLLAWDGSVAAPPELDRPRWTPAGPGDKHLGTLSYQGKSGDIDIRATTITPIVEAFEAVNWQHPVPHPAGVVVSAVKQSLNQTMARLELDVEFFCEGKGNARVWRWRPATGREVLNKPLDGKSGVSPS